MLRCINTDDDKPAQRVVTTKARGRIYQTVKAPWALISCHLVLLCEAVNPHVASETRLGRRKGRRLSSLCIVCLILSPGSKIKIMLDDI